MAMLSRQLADISKHFFRKKLALWHKKFLLHHVGDLHCTMQNIYNAFRGIDIGVGLLSTNL